MTTMIAEIYDALREAGASEQRSRAAAETLASYDSRFASMDRQFDGVRAYLKELRIELQDARAEGKGDVRFVQWQIGLVLAGILALVLKAFFGP